MKVPRSDRPPAYPPPVTPAYQRQAVEEGRALQANPLTHGRFNLASLGGRIYLGFAFALMLFVAGGLGWHIVREGLPQTPVELLSLACLAIGMVGMMSYLALMYLKHRRISRMLAMRCPKCGYDLRATPERCPECGAVPGGGS